MAGKLEQISLRPGVFVRVGGLSRRSTTWQSILDIGCVTACTHTLPRHLTSPQYILPHDRTVLWLVKDCFGARFASPRFSPSLCSVCPYHFSVPLPLLPPFGFLF